MFRSCLLLAIGGFLCLPLTALDLTAGEITPRLHAELSRAQDAPIPVIVTLRDQLDLQAFVRERGPVGKLSHAERKAYRVRLVESLKRRADLSQAELRGFLQGRVGGRIKNLWHINSLAFVATPELIEQLAARPEVAGISYDRPLTKPVVTPRTAAQVVPLADSNANAIEDNLELAGAAPLWNLGLTGLGSTVAIIDSGVDLDHPDLVDRWRGGGRAGWLNAVAENCDDPQINCLTACDTNTAEPCDFQDNSGVAHGTGVAGIAVGGSASGTAIGVAPDATWIAAKIFDSQDGSSISVISEAFAWLLNPDNNLATDDAPDVVNASWGFDPGQCVQGSPADLQILRASVQALQAAGIALSFSAGNGGPDPATSVSPANYPESFAVGSVGTFTSATEISAFSGRGPSACGPELYPDVVAPGLFILTTDLFQAPDPFAYIEISGTSFAAPHVAGVFAQLLGVGGFPAASVEVLYQALTESATDLGTAGPDNNYGNGLLNAALAYNQLLPPLPVAILPANGSTGLPLEVTLGWSQPADRFGSLVTNQLLLATDPGFTELVPTTAAVPATTDRKVMLGMAGLLLLPLGLLRRPLHRRLAGVLLMVLLVAGLVSCGGGGGGSAATPDRSVSVAGLSPGTTYFWKVTAQTDRGGPLSESAVFSFTTAP